MNGNIKQNHFMKKLSVFSNLYAFLYSVEHKRRYFEKLFFFLNQYNESQMDSSVMLDPTDFYGQKLNFHSWVNYSIPLIILRQYRLKYLKIF